MEKLLLKSKVFEEITRVVEEELFQSKLLNLHQISALDKYSNDAISKFKFYVKFEEGRPYLTIDETYSYDYVIKKVRKEVKTTVRRINFFYLLRFQSYIENHSFLDEKVQDLQSKFEKQYDRNIEEEVNIILSFLDLYNFYYKKTTHSNQAVKLSVIFWDNLNDFDDFYIDGVNKITSIVNDDSIYTNYILPSIIKEMVEDWEIFSKDNLIKIIEQVKRDN